MRAELLNRHTTLNGQEILLRTTEVRKADKAFEGIKDVFDFEIVKEKKKRSLDSNSYLWVLCQKIADVSHITREDVYQKAIRESGKYDDVALIYDAVDNFRKGWNNNGIGWFTDVFDSKLEGCKRIRCYYGSSIYDSAEMNKLIEYIVEEAKALEIETMTPDELRELNQKWSIKNG